MLFPPALADPLIALKVARKGTKTPRINPDRLRASRRFHESVFVMSVLTAAVGHSETPARLNVPSVFREHRSFFKTKEVLGEKNRRFSEI